MSDSGYFAQTTYSASAAQTDFSVGFAALSASHLVLTIDGTPSTDFSVTGDLPGGSGTLVYSGTSLSGGEAIVITRSSPSTFATLGFQSSAADPLAASDLDALVKGLLYLLQEALDRVTTLEAA